MALYAIVRSLFSEEKAATVVSMQFLCIILNTVSSICNGGFCKFITDMLCTSFLIFLQKVPPLQCEYLHIQDFEGKSIINVYLLAMKNEKVGTFCEVQKCELVVSNNTTISTGSKWKTLYTAQQYYTVMQDLPSLASKWKRYSNVIARDLSFQPARLAHSHNKVIDRGNPRTYCHSGHSLPSIFQKLY